MIDYTVAGNPKTFFHQDKTGSVIAMSDTSGNVAAGPWTYDPYGMPSSAAGEPYKFDGMRFDAETNCYYDRARLLLPGHRQVPPDRSGRICGRCRLVQLCWKRSDGQDRSDWIVHARL